MNDAALAGLKILEYAHMVSGPYCTRLLSDVGAEVIKVEPPLVGDPARRRGPFLNDVPHRERSGLFLYLNTNKMGVTLDPANATGRRIFKELVRESDILVEDTTPGTMERLGLEYESLQRINPRLVMTSITPFGQDGPYSRYRAYHLNTYHGSGVARILSSILPHETPQPVKAPGFLSDFDCGLNAATATMAALYSRLFTGCGQHIDISAQESLIALERVEIGMYGNEGDNRFSTVFMQHMVGGLQRCRDGYVLITLGGEHHWDGLVKLLGEPEWTKDKKLRGEMAKYRHASEINRHIAEWMKDKSVQEVYHKGQAFNCPVGIIATVEDLARSEQLQARNFFVDIEHPEMGRVKFPTTSYRFSVTPVRYTMAAPLLGEHNEEILCHRLGYASGDLVKMRAAGII